MASGFRMDGFTLKLYHSWPKTYSILMAMVTRPVSLRNLAFLLVFLAVLCPTDLYPQECPELLNVLPSGWKNLDVENHKIYFAVSRTFYILDISNPTNPEPLSFMFFPTDISAVDVVGNYAFITCEGETFLGVEGSLKVIDVSNSSSPTEVASYGPLLWAHHVCVSGNYAYVSDYGGGLKIIDISDPENPCEAGAWIIEGVGIGSSVVQENKAHIQYSKSSSLRLMSILDVSDPLNPYVLGDYGVEGFDIEIKGDFAYIVYYNALRIFNISNPAKPVEVGMIDTPKNPFAVAVHGDYAYVADRNNGLRIFYVSDPANPVEVALREDLKNAYRLLIADTYMYVCGNYNSGLNIFDLSNPEDPSLVGFFPTFSIGSDMWFKEENIYIIGGGLYIYDISNPNRPSVICSYYDLWGVGSSMFIDNTSVYITLGTIGLGVIDISDPYNPINVSSYNTPGNAQDIFVFNNYAYIADGTKGLRIIDVSDADNLTEVGALENIIINNLDVRYPYAYLTKDNPFTLHVIDISDPYNPFIISTYERDSYALNIEVFFPYAYIPSGEDGFYIIDILDPYLPFEAGHHGTNSTAMDVTISGDIAYVADGGSGLCVFNIRDRAHPIEMGCLDTPGWAVQVKLSGDLAVVSDREWGTLLFDVSGCRSRSHDRPLTRPQ